ncbi:MULTISPECIES: helix-turn-helix domain-containing protein [Methanobacterium]|uniref:hypothetical protein n=1 Tax=Methanobacterium TaxID=2160 RepID=UPI0015B3A45C|nr:MULTISPECIES: hypothetical protein [Methanobacterium]
MFFKGLYLKEYYLKIVYCLTVMDRLCDGLKEDISEKLSISLRTVYCHMAMDY